MGYIKKCQNNYYEKVSNNGSIQTFIVIKCLVLYMIGVFCCLLLIRVRGATHHLFKFGVSNNQIHI